jgi:GH18 family chitinase
VSWSRTWIFWFVEKEIFAKLRCLIEYKDDRMTVDKKLGSRQYQMPLLYKPVTRNLIGYDDPGNIVLKVNFANCKEAPGVGIWDISFDSYSNKEGQLFTAVN